MAAPEKNPSQKLLQIKVPRRIEASPEEVFDAWADPLLFRRWFEPHRSIFRKAAVDELWYWEADHAGRLWAHYCRYLRVERPKLLEFTWMSEATRGLESRVSVELTPSRGGTDRDSGNEPGPEMRAILAACWRDGGQRSSFFAANPARCSPNGSEHVSPGETALSTCTARGVSRTTMSSTSWPLRSTICARLPA